MKKTLKLLAAGLLFGAASFGGLVLAQNFTSAVQLSQDPRGPMPVDSAQNVYLTNNRHLNAIAGASPGPTTASTGCTMVAGSTDFSGQMSGCTGASNVVTFGQAYGVAPRCVVSSSNATSAALAITTTTTQLTITQTAATATFSWFCSGVS